jgi:hypothetical protein
MPNWNRVLLSGLIPFAVALAQMPSPSEASLVIKENPFSDADPFGLSPYWNWKTIETEHFRITFPEELKAIANRSANLFEEAHQILAPVLRWEAHYKVQVLVIDNEDSANGLTSALGRFGMILWATPPESWYSTSFYDDWLRLLVIHEYTHFLNLDATSEFWAVLRYFFGDTLLPNGTWAPWMLEGLAVYMETRFTKAGRGRSPFYEMVLRAAVEKGVLDSPHFIQIDQITGSNPYFPRGDTRYQFGYHLMNQVAQLKLPGSTADGRQTTSGMEDSLGILSKRGSGRIPFFINSNLEGITGKDWYQFWNEWVTATRTRMKKDLEIIHSQPVNSYEFLTSDNRVSSNEVSGSAVSPDGKWIAYTLVSANRRQGLYLKNLETGKVRRLDDKLAGVGMSFTPDSKALVYSELNVKSLYYTASDLKIYDLERNSIRFLSHRLRARDPDVSPDGKWVTFTFAEQGFTGLAIAPLIAPEKDGGNYQIGEIQKLYTPQTYDRVSGPKFSPDGERIVFTFHKNGKSQEDLVELNRKTGSTQVLISNGFYNRYPAFRSNGDLFFVSNITGVDNLYQYQGIQQAPLLVTNMTTGVAFPCFNPKDNSSQLYASVFSYTGWNLARVQLLNSPANPNQAKVLPPPAPQMDQNSIDHSLQKVYSVENYSAYPSILPRTWAPLVAADSSGAILGAQTGGFDALNRHRYVLAGTYATELKLGDGYALYSNRSLGPALNLAASVLTTNFNDNSLGYTFSRQTELSTSAAFPILSTYSNWTPAIGFNIQRQLYYQYNSTDSRQSLLGSSRIVPNIDAILTFSNLETSSLAISAEGGRQTRLGSRYYLNPNDESWKLLFMDYEHVRLTDHTILIPSFKATWVSHISSNYTASNALASGRTLQQVLGAFSGDDFDQLSIRGYPGLTYVSKAVTTAALDLRFPIMRIFRGWGTNPMFLDNLYGLAFAETTYFPYSSAGVVLPSVGAGLRLSTELFFFPVTFSGEYHYGTNRDRGGQGDLFFQILAQGLRF